MDRRRQGGEDLLVLLEHEPVITLGRGADPANLLLSPESLARRGIDLQRVGRGGDVTYHGPGQLVGYPIVDLERRGRDLHRYLRSLEAMLIALLGDFGLAARRISGKTGVWVGEEKIASIGIGVRRWVAWHGFALNVSADLGGFEAIVPCGLPGVRMTSMESLLGAPVPLEEVCQRAVAAFERTFDLKYGGEYEEIA